MFEGEPVIPLTFIIHDRKFQKVHEALLENLKQKIPRLKSKNICIVTDREIGIVNAFKNIFPNLKVLICWNHILKDIKEFLRKKGATTSEQSVYEGQVKKLLQCENEEEFHRLLNGNMDTENNTSEVQDIGYRNIWSECFKDHFDNSLQDVILNNAGRWILEEKNIYNPYSGITNNASESINAKLK